MGATVVKTFQFRCLPTPKQAAHLNYLLWHTRQLYNAALQERIDCYKRTGKSITYYDQCKSVTQIRAELPEFKDVWVMFQRGALQVLDEAYKHFFRRVKTKKGKVGFPRFKGARRWNSLQMPYAVNYEHGAVKIKGVDKLRVIAKRKIEGTIKNAILKKDVFGWRINIVAEVLADIKPKTNKKIGIDVGISKFITDSNGNEVANPQFLKRSLRHLRRIQRAYSRKKKDSRRFKICRRRVIQAHWKVAERRRGFHWAVIDKLINNNDVICAEDLQVSNMGRNRRLSRSIHDVGWASFINKLFCKAEETGKQLIKVAPHGTSQQCSGCGEVVPKKLSERTHKCGSCGLILDRDHNAAINILRAGISPPPVKLCKTRVKSPATVLARAPFLSGVKT